MKDPVFGPGTTTRMFGSPESFRIAKLKDPFKGRQVKRRMGKGKGKGKGGFKGNGWAYLGEEQAQDPEWWSEEDCVWWSKGKKRQERFFER